VSRTLVTSALTYANGPIHFGHVAGAYLSADVYVRTLRMQGEDVLFICGTDEYGVAVTLGAEREGRPYAEYVAHWHDVILSLFDRFGIQFDIFSGTSTCPHHAETAQEFFRQLEANGYLERKETRQLYCTHDEMFLADRYVRGTCYVCGETGARGDECPACGTWIEVLRLKEPECTVCGNPPEERATTHWYLDMPKLRDEYMGRWIEEHEWKPNVAAFIKNMMKDVPKRAITRDMQWGIPVPAEVAAGEMNKVLYVWFDAPIGYISFTKEWAEKRGEPELWEAYWKGPDTRIVHFIGKDNIPFHCMVFPSMLHGVKQGYALPWQVPANEFYNLQGAKFSTSAGWYIPLDEFFEKYDNEVARFYLLSSMPETADSDFKWEEFQRIANASLAGTIGNLATRVLKFIAKNMDGSIPHLDPAHEAELDEILLAQCGAIGDPGEHVLAFRFRRAAEQLVANATVANVFVDRLAPWALNKTDPGKAGSALSTLCQWIALLARWMAPMMPGKAQRLWLMLGQEGDVAAQGWPEVPRPGAWRTLATGRPIGTPEALFARIDDATVQAEIESLRARAVQTET